MEKTPISYSKEVTQPYLYGDEEDYGIVYPEGYEKPEPPTAEDLRAIVESGSLGKLEERQELDYLVWKKKQEEGTKNIADMNADQFLSFLDKQYGNPYKQNPYQEAQIKYKAGIPDLWKSFFRGKKPIGGALTKNEQKQWIDVVNRFKTDVFNESLAQQQFKQEARGEALKNWNMIRESKQTIQDQLAQKQKEQEMAEYREGLEDMDIYNPKTGESKKINKREWPTFQKKNPDWTDVKPAKKEKGLSSATIQRISKAIDKFATESDDTKSALMLKAINAMLEAEGLPPVKTKITEGERKWYNPVSWFYVPKEVEYEVSYKKKSPDTSSQLQGMKPGWYMVDGQKVKWDGRKVIQ